MSIRLMISRGAHGFLAFLFSVSVLLCAVPAAQAAPTEEIVTGWVDIQAQVPEGFKGSVSVLLENKATGETQIVTSYYLNDYANSMQIPLGEYIVVSAFTSEDSFIYEASTKTEQFVLKDNIKIDVSVSHNPEGEGILANISQEPPDVPEPSETQSPAPSNIQSAVSEDKPTEGPDSDSDVQQDEAPSGAPEGSEEPAKEGDEAPSSAHTLAKTVRNILLSIAATLAFLIGTTLLVVFIRFKFGSD